MQKMPLVSVITPSYNQGVFIQQTIESILLQDYPHIELIVMDGASTDNTLNILQQYSASDDRFRFVTKPDRGQSHAINKGLKMARGDIIGWLNSDDTYLPGAVGKAVHALLHNPDWAVVYGRSYLTDELNHVIGAHEFSPYNRQMLFHKCMISQPSAFIRKRAFEAAGGVDESLYFCMDYDLWMRISQNYSMGHVDEYWSNARIHPSSKTTVHFADIGLPEVLRSQLKTYGAVSNCWILTYLYYHIEKGTDWLISEFRKYRIVDNTPQKEQELAGILRDEPTLIWDWLRKNNDRISESLMEGGKS